MHASIIHYLGLFNRERGRKDGSCRGRHFTRCCGCSCVVFRVECLYIKDKILNKYVLYHYVFNDKKNCIKVPAILLFLKQECDTIKLGYLNYSILAQVGRSVVHWHPAIAEVIFTTQTTVSIARSVIGSLAPGMVESLINLF